MFALLGREAVILMKVNGRVISGETHLFPPVSWDRTPMHIWCYFFPAFEGAAVVVVTDGDGDGDFLSFLSFGVKSFLNFATKSGSR